MKKALKEIGCHLPPVDRAIVAQLLRHDFFYIGKFPEGEILEEKNGWLIKYSAEQLVPFEAYYSVKILLVHKETGECWEFTAWATDKRETDLYHDLQSEKATEVKKDFVIAFGACVDMGLSDFDKNPERWHQLSRSYTERKCSELLTEEKQWIYQLKKDLWKTITREIENAQKSQESRAEEIAKLLATMIKHCGELEEENKTLRQKFQGKEV